MSSPELNRFLKFIKSPYFNKNEKITTLAVYVINRIKNKQEVEEKNVVWELLETKSDYSDLKFRKLCNDLLDRFENFLATENMLSQKLLMSNLLLDSIKNRKLGDLIEKHIQQSSTNLNRNMDRSSDYYLQKYYQQKTLNNFKTNYQKKTELKKGSYNSYADMDRSLDAFYVIEKLRLATDLQTWKKMYKREETIDISLAIQLVENSFLSKIPHVNIYFLMYSLYVNQEDEKTFYQLKQLAKDNINRFPQEEQREIFEVIISYCIRRVNKADMNFHKETLLNYEWGISTEILLQNGELSPTAFRNYVVIGLRVGEYEKVERFIKNNAELLALDRRENALNFNMARVDFYRKDFDSVVGYLSKVNYDDIWYNVNSKMLLIATYYEKDEIDLVMLNIDSFQTFLRREKSLDENKRKLYNSFNRYLKKLIKVNFEKSKLSALRDKVSADQNVGNKKWLLEKIEALLS